MAGSINAGSVKPGTRTRTYGEIGRGINGIPK